MPNSWFEFKQFKVWQDLCGMKVSTDACILGAIAYEHIQSPIKKILDIGTGTGLLSLMLAQNKFTQSITAVEIDAAAVQQAQLNFKLSPWSSKLACIQMDINDYEQLKPSGYDLVICNPPFFENQLQAEETKKNIAKHEVLFNKHALAKAIEHVLTNDGLTFILYPTSEWHSWEKAASLTSLNMIKKIAIHPKENKPPNRVIGIFSKQTSQEVVYDDLLIRSKNNEYTKAFNNLLKEFYLHY